MKRIVRTVLVGTATVGIAVGMAMPASAVELLPGGCHILFERVYCQIR
ncbi:hypothetical protein [Ornithinimicrobium sufpigmenti]|nr:MULTISPECIES: hypothetical protein [unclassified Ornithinimicrobium]